MNVNKISKLIVAGIFLLLINQVSINSKYFRIPTKMNGLAATAYCTDSDGGINYEVAGTTSGVGPNGYQFIRNDVCQTGDALDTLKEFYCQDNLFSAKSYFCINGCLDGACLTFIPTCTDGDNDTFAIEGGICGSVDCDDSNPQVNPGAQEACGNGIDDNCDGLIDGQDPICLVCTDSDGDSYALEGGACGAVDCDDSNPSVNPGASEVCGNGIDDDCNGKTDSEEPACGAPMNVIVIGWDGVQRDHLMECYNKTLPECSGGLPNLAVLDNGVIYDFTVTNGGTSTKPGWAQILTGYNAEVTGVYDNGIYQPIPEGYTLFEKLENHFAPENIVTMFISGKYEHTGGACIGEPTLKNGLEVIETKGEPWCITKTHLDYFENGLKRNNVVGNRALELLTIHQNDLFFAFFLFWDPDVTGHVGGENSYQYSNLMIDDDRWLGLIVNKLEELDILDNTLIYLVSDHGFDEGKTLHSNAPFTIFASNDPLVIREGDRKDLAPTILERYGISTGATGDAPPVNGSSQYSIPTNCIVEGQAYIDYPEAPKCCPGLTVIPLHKVWNLTVYSYATGGTGDQSGYCTYCGDGICKAPENRLNCTLDCK